MTNNQSSRQRSAVQCSTLIGVCAAFGGCLALFAAADGQQKSELRGQAAVDEREDDQGKPNAPGKKYVARHKTAPQYRIDRDTNSDKWHEVVLQCLELPLLLNGGGQLTLIRVVLEDGQPDALVQLSSGTLVLPKPGAAVSRYQQVKNGDFVLVQHIQSAQRRNGKDPVEIGSFTHHRSTIWVDVPTKGELAVMGTVILSRVPKEEMGRIEAIATSEAEEQLDSRQFCIGPLVVGGPYGRSFPFRLGEVTNTGRIAPGEYKIVLPDFDMQSSRWTVSVLPNKVTQLKFTARSQQVIEKAQEKIVLDLNWKEREAQAAIVKQSKGTKKKSNPKPEDRYRKVLKFLTLEPSELPDSCKRSAPPTAPIVPAGIVIDRKQITLIATFFGMDARAVRDVQAAVTVVYEEQVNGDGKEMGVFASCFSDDKSGKKIIDRLHESVGGHNDRVYVANGGLALFLWRDKGVSDPAFASFCDYFRKTKFQN